MYRVIEMFFSPSRFLLFFYFKLLFHVLKHSGLLNQSLYLCLCIYLYVSSLSVPRGQTKLTSAPTRQLLPRSPPLHCPPTQPPQYRTGVCVCIYSRVSTEWYRSVRYAILAVTRIKLTHTTDPYSTICCYPSVVGP